MIKKMLNYSLFLILVLCCFIVDVNAASYTGFNFSAQFYDNVNGNLTAVTTAGPAAGTGHYEGYIAYTANSSGGAWGISSPTTLLANHTYTLTASIPNECGRLILSTYNRIGVGTTMSNAKTSYQNNTNVNEVYSKVIGGDNFLIQFAFTPTINGSFIVFPFSTDTSCGSSRTILESISIEDLGKDGVTEQQITNSLNTQTNELNNSIQNSTDTITGALGDVENSINENITNNFNSCYTNVLNNFNFETQTQNGITIINNGDNTFTINGTATKYTAFSMQNLTLNPNTYYTLSGGINSNAIMQVIEYKENPATQANGAITWYNTESSGTLYFVVFGGTTVNNVVIKPMLTNDNILHDYIPPQQEKCSNKIDETNDKLDETNNQLGDLNNNITSDNIDNNSVSNSFNDFEEFIDENATISSLITLPVTLFSAILNGMQSSCAPFNLGSLYGEDLILPCINISNYLGTTLWTMIDIIISGFAIYFISQKFIKVFNNFSSMKEGDVIDD